MSNFGGANMKNKNRASVNQAIQIGTVCVSSYVVSYYMRNVLSVSSPDMLKTGLFTKEFLGSLSSVYMLFYAIGQLINGIMGDIIKPKLMIVCGMVVCGLSSLFFSFTDNQIIQLILFALIGFSLSMLRGPLVKTISENTQPNHSRIICTFLSCAGFTGPLIASLISMFFDWRNTFMIAGIIALLIGFLAYFVFTLLEKKGHITYTFSKNSNGFKNIFKVFLLKHFIFYIFVGGIAEISAASINFWIPTYFTEQLCLNENVAKAIYSLMSFIKSVTPFVTLFFFNLLKEKDIKMIRFSFIFATVFFLGMRFVNIPYLNILFLLMAQMSIGSASSLLWSIYIPSQRESGMVSTINGVLDFSGYLFASAANILFAHTIGNLGWNGIVVLWCALPAVGFVMSMMTKQNK